MSNTDQIPTESKLQNQSDSQSTSSAMQVDQGAVQTPAILNSDRPYRSDRRLASGPMLVDHEAKRNPLEDVSELPNYGNYQPNAPSTPNVPGVGLYCSSTYKRC
jgi:hypothetical protein